MTIRVNKQPFNIREKLSELERPIGVKGSELMKSETVYQARNALSADRKNLVINGNMAIDQRNNGSSFTATDHYVLDVIDCNSRFSYPKLILLKVHYKALCSMFNRVFVVK